MSESEPRLDRPVPQIPQGLLLTGEGLSLMTPERLQMLGEMVGGLGLQVTIVGDNVVVGIQWEKTSEADTRVEEKIRLANGLIASYPDLVDLFQRGAAIEDARGPVDWAEEAREVYRAANRQSAQEGKAGGPGSTREDALITRFASLSHEAPELAITLNETLARSEIMDDRNLAAVLLEELGQQLPERILPILHGLMMDPESMVRWQASSTLDVLTESHDIYRYSQVREMVEDHLEGRVADTPGPIDTNKG